MLGDPDDIAILDALLALASSFGELHRGESESIQHGEMPLRYGMRVGSGYCHQGIWMPAHEFRAIYFAPGTPLILEGDSKP